MKKKILALSLCVVMLAIAIVGGTLAYFTDTKSATNTFAVGNVKIELLESTSPDGSIGKFIEKRGEGVHHVAFAVKNIEERLSECEAAGVQLIDKAPRGGAEGLSIAFLHPKSTGGVLTELCEDKNEK